MLRFRSSFGRRARLIVAALPLVLPVVVHAQAPAPDPQSLDAPAPAAPAGTTPTQSTPGVAAGITGPAVQQQQAETSGRDQEIIVTGSHIARPTLRSPIPVTTLSAADLTRSGNTNLGDALVRLPALSTSFNQAGSTAFIGTSGLNILDLRSLGQSRTLVLVNGHRHITSQEGEFLVDINTIPNDLVDRVDVVTGGSSAAYGSDAMAGVVNFVLKQNFDGLSANAQGGVSSHHDRGNYKLSVTAGKNFAEGRGNIAGSFEYDSSSLVTYADRPGLTGAFAGRRQFQLVDDPTADNTNPDRVFLQGVRSLGYADGGNFTAYNGSSIRSCAGAPSTACLPNGFPRIFLFNSDGSLREANYGTDFRPVGSGNTLGGDGSTLNNTGTLQPSYKRYIANILGHFDVSEAFRPYFEGKFVRTQSFNQGTPTFSQGGDQGLDADGIPFAPTNYLSYTPIALDNAFLTPQARSVISGLLPAGANYFNLNRNNVDLGTRDEADRRDTWRVVVGAQGTFNDDWHYDVAFNYGHLKTRSTFYNNRIEQNFYNSIDAVRNAAGDIVCRINQASVTDPACAPIDLLGAFGSQQTAAQRQAALDYFNTTSYRRGAASELDITANITGDSSQLFELPGGPVRFSIGGEYRREKAHYAYDELVSSGQTFLNAIPDFRPPAFAVKEAYGELDLPVLKNIRFVDELSLNGAVRVSDFKGSAGTVYAYNAGGIYAPVSDVRFRVNYSRSVRAPTLGDLYASNSINYAGVDDPCDVNFINKGSSTRAANCAAAGVPAGFENAVTRSSRLQILSGGNPDLQVEKSRSWTYGVILQPRMIPGLVVTVDYYDIKINQVISSVDAQTILNGCYDAASLSNAFCSLINPRNGDGSFQQPALLQSSLNFAAERAKGIDLDVAYNHRFGADDNLALRFIGNWNRFRTDYPYVDDPSRPSPVKGTLGQPAFQFNANADYTHKKVTIGYTLRFLGKQSIASYETQHVVAGLDGTPYDPYYADRVNYPNVFYHDIRATVQVDRRFSLYGGVDNATDRKPPFGLLGNATGYNNFDTIYDNVGRFFYVGARVKI
ncbi:TonB-dependent receptor domain-containing protein [Sphingomonas morindae]|uniref:TonB-dependent receptor n=1 Tax=Sphingomonas morindae TaxID=1541170 RepID=A0ABY4XDB5_9SPHN|nr:TonB-dependent receptor [Sphingomonas morindae]USI74756.1 TonB-dependent receptor [Sphingomonas morindae]